MLSLPKPIFLYIKDKTNIEGVEKYCPSHRLPHTLPVIGESIVDESCHIHKSKLRMAHHTTFCKILKCPNYQQMRETYEQTK
ncbi:hypothetical protein CMI46_00335 [Candidatus Pacearchaeota archaeon]|nr:hypothetical protein [Candidatus Pacearchaeota archaeon]|tara:strand:+ start:110 stop:355 length:246 start_codon:yes stop_codon:yes gene_type:complete